ncbi:MAG: response regulator transcription factor [Vulcanimicrobiaceae bacterium]
MYPVLIVLDSKCRVKFCTSHETIDDELLRLVHEDHSMLRADVEELVRGLISSCASSECVLDCNHFRLAALADGTMLRLVPLVGADEKLFALSLEADTTRNGLTRAARRFQLTRRESEVLALILEGFSASEIGESLHIAENTVQGYFKRLLSKTNSRNRPAMVANVLDWDRAKPGGFLALHPMQRDARSRVGVASSLGPPPGKRLTA